jgi:uncharacterized protein (DUF3084 family)
MSLIERVTGYFPVASERAKAAWNFASSPKGKAVIAVVAAIVFLAWVFHRGEVRGLRQVAALQEQVATLKSQLAAAKELASEIKTDADVAHSKADALQGRLKSSEALTSQLNQKVNDYVQELAKRKTPRGCIATPDDVRSLQRIQ